ncbi:MAG: SEC-C metal-binding domain-containing protein [Sediminibacterium sp.]|nr:SEC-C metal-binding domain-containing protein [Sediminibacterium sp.]
MHNYNLKKQDISNNSLQLLKNVAQHNPNLERVVMPITNGRLILNIPIIYKEANDSKGITISNEIEKIVFLHFIDDLWKEHLRLMDDLKHSVQTATYEQKDPLLIYKIEAFELFNNFNQQLSQKVSQFLSHIEIYHQPNEQPLRPKLDRDNIQKKEKLIESRNELNSGNAPETNNESKQEPIKAGPKIGRNDPCPCGSEKKYKNCHG